MSKIVQMSMFIDQHAGKDNPRSSAREIASGSFKIPFSSWIVGYVVIADQKRSSNDEEWTIKEIKSSDQKMHREDCSVVLVNKAQEVREVKGSTLQSGYEFKSTGDLPAPAPTTVARTDVKPIGIDLEGMREWYPRNGGEGTRLIMHDKTVYIVLEDFNTIWGWMHEAGLTVAAYTEHRKRKTNEGAMTGPELQGN